MSDSKNSFFNTTQSPSNTQTNLQQAINPAVLGLLQTIARDIRILTENSTGKKSMKSDKTSSKNKEDGQLDIRSRAKLSAEEIKHHKQMLKSQEKSQEKIAKQTKAILEKKSFSERMRDAVTGAPSRIGRMLSGQLKGAFANLSNDSRRILRANSVQVDRKLRDMQIGMGLNSNQANALGSAMDMMVIDKSDLAFLTQGQRDALRNLSGTLEEAFNRTNMQAVGRLGDSMFMIKNTVQVLGKVFKLGLQTLMTAFQPALDAIQEVLGDIISTVMDIFDSPEFKAIVDMLTVIVSDLVERLMPIITRILELIMDTIMRVLNVIMNIVDSLMPLIEVVIDVLMEIIDIILTLFGDIINVVLGIFEDPAFRSLLDTVVNVIGALLQAVMPIIARVLEVIASVLSTIMDVVGGVLIALMPIIEVILDVLMTILVPILMVIETILMAILLPIEILLEVINMVLTPILEIIASFLQVILTPLTIMTDLLSMFLPILAMPLEFIAKLLDVVMPILMPLFEIMAFVLSLIHFVIASVFNVIMRIHNALPWTRNRDLMETNIHIPFSNTTELPSIANSYTGANNVSSVSNQTRNVNVEAQFNSNISGSAAEYSQEIQRSNFTSANLLSSIIEEGT